MKSQIKPSERIMALASKVGRIEKPADLIKIRNLLYRSIIFKPYSNRTKKHESRIRWRRTADQILKDGYVYEGKACTDIVVTFLALCHALDLKTRFVKLIRDKYVHSVAEIRIRKDWYIFDVANQKSKPIKGTITKSHPYKRWRLWKKGRDAWDLGLANLESINLIK